MRVYRGRVHFRGIFLLSGKKFSFRDGHGSVNIKEKKHHIWGSPFFSFFFSLGETENLTNQSPLFRIGARPDGLFFPSTAAKQTINPKTERKKRNEGRHNILENDGGTSVKEPARGGGGRGRLGTPELYDF